MEDTDQLAGYLATAWYEHLFDSSKWHVRDQVYELAGDEDYRSLGENPDAEDAPLILKRESDGAFFEIDLDVTASRTTPEARAEWRERLRRQAERAQAATARRSQ